MQGYAFAEYYDIPTAQSAQRNLTGTEVAGRALRVDFADHESEPSLFELANTSYLVLHEGRSPTRSLTNR